MRSSSAASSTRAPRPMRRRGGSRSMSSACRRRARTCARSAKGRASARPRRRSRASSRAPASPRSTRRGSRRTRRRASSTSPSIERPGRPTPEVLGRDPAGHRPRLPVAEIDALGRGLGGARLAALGAPAARDRLHLRAGDRGARDRALRGRRHPRRRRDAAATASWRRRRSRCGALPITSRRSSRRRSCSTPTGART